MMPRSWITTGLATAGQYLLTLVTGIMLARMLGPEGRGVVTTITVWAALAAGIGCLSLNEATVLLLARGRRANAPPATGRLESTALSLQLAVGAASAALLVVALTQVRGLIPDNYRPFAVLYAVLFVPLTMMLMHQKAVLQAYARFSTFNVLRIAQPSTYLVGLIALLLMSRFEWRGVIWALLGSAAVSALLGAVLAGAWRLRWSAADARLLLTTGLRFQGVNILVYFGQEFDKLFVVYQLDERSVGLYTGALAFAVVGFGFISQTVSAVLFPSIAREADEARRRAQIVYATNATIALAALINGTMAALAPVVVIGFYGVAFQDSVPLLQILLLGTGFKAVRFTVDQSLRATNVLRPSLFAEAINVAVFITAAIALVGPWGLSGVSWALVLGQGLALAFLSAEASRHFRVPIFALWGLRQGAFGQMASALVSIARRVAWRGGSR